MNTDSTTETQTARSIVHSVIRGERLDYDSTRAVFSALGAGLLTDLETAALLAGLHARGETATELAGAADAFRAAARPFPKASRPLVEIVGTGGDGVGTINISTGAGLTAASMGLAVAKHGNRAVSSKTGAADVIAELGLPLDLTPEQAARTLEDDGFAFLFAQAYHPAMRFVAPVRTALASPTIFNILGPLINPADISYQLMGVAEPKLLDMIAQTLHRLGRERALVVNGLGLDEITLHGTTSVREVTPEGVRRFEVSPEDLGVKTRPLAELLGGDPAENARILRAVFEGRGSDGQRESIGVNAGALLYLVGRVDSLAEGTQAALDQLASGRVADYLDGLAKNSRSIAEGRVA